MHGLESEELTQMIRFPKKKLLDQRGVETKILNLLEQEPGLTSEGTTQKTQKQQGLTQGAKLRRQRPRLS